MYKLEWVDDPNPFMVASKATLLHQGEPILLVKILLEEGRYFFRIAPRGFSDPLGWIGAIPCGPFDTVEEAKRAVVTLLPEWLAFRARQAKQILTLEPEPLLAPFGSYQAALSQLKRDASLILKIETLLTNSNSEGK